MLQLKNETPFSATLAVLPDAGGIDTMYVVVKATFGLGDKTAVPETQAPVLLADEFWGEPGQSSLRYVSDVHPAKPATDVVMNAHAWAPNGRKVQHLDVTLSVAGRSQAVRVFGDRVWKPGALWFCPAGRTAPKPFERMPLVYERAFGGTQTVGGRVLFETRNPVGLGFAGKLGGRKLKGLPLPNLESAAKRIRTPKDRPAPAGFGYVAPSWEPRKTYAGTYDEAWMAKRAPYLPKDFDSRFFNAAHPDLVMDRYLTGGEPVEIVNASPRGPLRFRLPAAELAASLRIKGREEPAAMNLETVLIEPDESRLSMLWRGAVTCDKRALQVEEARITMKRLSLDGGRA